MANSNLTNAKKAKNDEFYTQYHDIEKEINAYVEYNPDVFKGKTILLPCDDPEWSNFTKFFAQNFELFGLKKLISTSYAAESKNLDVEFQPTLFETNNPHYDTNKTTKNGKIFTLTKDKNKDGKVDVDDLEWEYLEGDGDFRNERITALRDEADIIITNPPFSLFRPFLEWIVEADKQFVIIGNMNAITYKEVFPLIKENKMWLGNGFHAGNAYFATPLAREYADGVYNPETNLVKFRNCDWFTNIDHARRHESLPLMTIEDNKKYNTKVQKNQGSYQKYNNYDAIEISFTNAIPSDYDGIMGVPISFLDKYNPDQFEIIGNGQTMANELGINPVGQKFVDDYYAQGNKGSINAKWNNLVYNIDEKVFVPYQRILIKHKK
jgi:hypothetical protein